MNDSAAAPNWWPWSAPALPARSWTFPPLPANGASARSSATWPTLKWSARDRFSRVIAEDNPTIIAYDEAAWAEKLNYRQRKFSQALETFRRIRGENHELFKSVPEEAYSRQGTHSFKGAMTLLDLLKMYAEHAEGHALQIRAARDAYKASKAG